MMQSITTENKLFTIMPPTPQKRKLAHAQHPDANFIAGFDGAPAILHRLYTWLCTAWREQSRCQQSGFCHSPIGQPLSAYYCERGRRFAKFALSRRAANASELHGLQNVVLQQMEQDTMAQSQIAAENPSDQAAAARRMPKDLRSSARPSPRSRPPVANDGLETLRSNDC
jgi:hypothetical protein